jgi:hypothetical protein
MGLNSMYDENERLVSLKQLDAFGLNPFACWGMIESYIKNVHPLPVKLTYEHFREDEVMDGRAPTKSLVELSIYAVGNVSTKFWGNPQKLDPTYTKLFCRSYYEYMRPLPVSFQLMDAIEVHLRTPGVAEYDQKNPLRNMWQLRAKG